MLNKVQQRIIFNNSLKNSYAANPKIYSNQSLLKMVKDLRAGSLAGVVGSALMIGLILYLFSLGDGFVLNNLDPGWNLPNRVQPEPPSGTHRYPPILDVLDPKSTSYADRPGGSRLMANLYEQPQSRREDLTQISSDVVPTQTQMASFIKDGKVDLNLWLDEVYRRAEEIGCSDFECSLERFRALATENGNLSNSIAREAISRLQGEILGFYKDTRRENYGEDINGPDFLVTGLGKFENITHVEIKNPVGSAIKIANGQSGSISRQGKRIGKKILYQQRFWSDPTDRNRLENINPTAYFPQSPNNVLGAVDIFDVPPGEKVAMESSITKWAANSTN